jgi:hypothetical protein
LRHQRRFRRGAITITTITTGAIIITTIIGAGTTTTIITVAGTITTIIGAGTTTTIITVAGVDRYSGLVGAPLASPRSAIASFPNRGIFFASADAHNRAVPRTRVPCVRHARR